MENKREHIYLAALLHDIGKFYQRADTGSVGTSKFLSETVKKLESTLLPSFNGKTTHKHALWTAQFIIENEQVFKKLLGASDFELSGSDNLINIAGGHHLPNTQQSELGKIIKEADSLSSGIDRDSEFALMDDQDEQENNWNVFKKKRMTSILEAIGMSKQELESKSDWHHMPVEKLRLSSDSFPKKKFSESPDYEKLWNEFTRDFKFIQAESYRTFSETLLNLLFKYTVTIPSSTVHFPDVSLYDHSKMTAALAICLYDNLHNEGDIDNPFLLIGADFSGIQPYIYQIVSKYAGKNLKGRSFYLRLLSDAVVRYLLNELNLFQSNIIYNSGGSFYLLAPNTTFVKEKLKNAIETIDKNMLHAHGTTLFLAIDSISLSKDALMNQNNNSLQEVWKELFEKRDKKKNRKFNKEISENYATFFEPAEFGVEADKISGEGISKDEKTYDLPDVGTVKQLTYKQVQLGKRLRESELLVVSYGEIAYWKKKNPIEPAGLGIFFYLINKSDLKELSKELKASADFITIITLNGKEGNCEFMYGDSANDWIVKGIDNVYGLEFYGGNLFDGKTFDEFCNKESEDAFRRLGVLRMDVDNLGHIFQTGILPERSTLSRYAALSRSFDYFFSGYLNTIQQAVAPETSFIIYSGGDDLFIVASWEDAIELAKAISKKFREFTCHNPAFSLSGGIAIVTPKFPIMKGAKESEEEEHLAKTHSNHGKEKNALSFMDTPLNWDSEFNVVENLKDELVKHLNNDLPKSFVGKILQHAQNANIENHKINNLKTFWIASYDLSRMTSRIKNSEMRTLIDNCKNEICIKGSTLNGKAITTEYHALELWAVAARWAELEIRTNK